MDEEIISLCTKDQNRGTAAFEVSGICQAAIGVYTAICRLNGLRLLELRKNKGLCKRRIDHQLVDLAAIALGMDMRQFFIGILAFADIPVVHEGFMKIYTGCRADTEEQQQQKSQQLMKRSIGHRTGRHFCKYNLCNFVAKYILGLFPGTGNKLFFMVAPDDQGDLEGFGFDGGLAEFADGNIITESQLELPVYKTHIGDDGIFRPVPHAGINNDIFRVALVGKKITQSTADRIITGTGLTHIDPIGIQYEPVG